MKPRISVITLGVQNLEKSVHFYQKGLGLKTEGIIGKEFEFGAVAFFDLQSGLKLALWDRKSISHDTKIPLSAPCPTEMTIGYNVNSKGEVDEVMKEAKRAEAKIIKEAGDTFWGGYAGYFQDPDGHVWEIAWNPAFKVQD